jgi:MFS family permease
MNKKNLIVFYFYSFFTGFYLANGTTVLFDRVLGFSYSRIFTLGAVYMLMFVLFNVPAGALADVIGRKKTLIFGSFTLVLAAIATGVSSNFTQVLLSFFLWSLGFSLISGADEALLYDALHNEDAYSRAWGRASFFSLLGLALAGILGPILFSKSFRFPYLFSAVSFFLSGACLFFFSENAVKGGLTLKHHLNKTYQGIKIAFSNKYVLWAIGVLALVFGSMYTFSNSYQPYLQNIGFSIKAFSIILPLMFIVQALGGYVSGKLYNKKTENIIFILSLVIIAACFVVLGLFNGKLNLIILFVYSAVQGIIQPIISTYTNRFVDTKFRATVVSVQSMVATAAAALLLFLFGYLTDRVGLNNLLIILGFLVLAFGVALLALKPKTATE